MVEEERMNVGLSREDSRGGEHEGWFGSGGALSSIKVDCWR